MRLYIFRKKYESHLEARWDYFRTTVELVDPGCPQPGHDFLLKNDVLQGISCRGVLQYAPTFSTKKNYKKMGTA